MPSRRGLLVVAVLCATLLGALLQFPAMAQDRVSQGNPVPPGMSGADYNAMVQDIARATADHLRASGAAAGPSASGPLMVQADQTAAGGEIAMAEINQMAGRLGEIWSAFDVTATYRSLDEAVRAASATSAFRFFVLLILGIGVGVAVEIVCGWLLRRLVGPWLFQRADISLPILARVSIRGAIEFLPLAALIFVLYVFSRYVVTNGTIEEAIANIAFGNALIWRALTAVLRIWLRPGEPDLRITMVNDADARRLYHALSLGVLLYMVGRSNIRILMAAGLSDDTIVVAAFANNILYTIVDLGVIWVIRHPMARWLESLIDGADQGWGHTKRLLARYWFVLGVGLDIVMSVGLAYGALTGKLNVGGAVSASLNLVFSLLLIETFADYVERRGRAQRQPDEDVRSDLPGLVTRCLRFVLWVFICIAIAQSWLFDVLSLVPPGERRDWEQHISKAALAMIFAYLTWQIACHAMARHSPRSGPANGEPHAEDDAHPSTRLATLLPLARVTFGVVVSVLTVLIVLSELGVNTAPLIAGASVFGLALSFGSQTLVKDIISGVFYLTDDAFRIGEYIESGGAKGTVEGFTLRSIKLRHHNGQLHIIPFGQLGSITNFSRDWITVKFNLRLDRNVDLEIVRKTVKKIGQEILDDPEIGPLILEPLKMQGIAEIHEWAIVVRFKFTSKPGRATIVQRQAMKMIFDRFAELGIGFARPPALPTVATA